MRGYCREMGWDHFDQVRIRIYETNDNNSVTEYIWQPSFVARIGFEHPVLGKVVVVLLY